MKIAVTVTSWSQTGIDTRHDIHITKVFEESVTLKEIDTWIKSINDSANFSSVRISLCVD